MHHPLNLMHLKLQSVRGPKYCKTVRTCSIVIVIEIVIVIVLVILIVKVIVIVMVIVIAIVIVIVMAIVIRIVIVIVIFTPLISGWSKQGFQTWAEGDSQTQGHPARV